jgi:NitT/TauT family transport system substrate-binding protein
MRNRSIVLGALCCAVVAGCGGDAPETTAGDAAGGDAPAALETVVYAGSNWYGHAPVWVGIEQGIFEEAGFAVEASAFGSSPNRVTALENGNAQLASLGEVAMLEAMAEDRSDFYWIGNQDIAPGAEGLVAVGIDKIEDLRGKKIAVNVNTSVHITVYELLKGAGLDLQTDVEILRGDDSAIVDLVRSGEAQAGIIWEPFYTQLRELPGAVVLGTDMDTSIYERFKTMTGPDMVCMSKAWVDADPDRARRLVRAYFEAVRWCRDNPEALIGLIAEHVNEDESKVQPVVSNFKWLVLEDQAVAMSDAMLFGQARAASEILVEMGLAKKVPEFRKWTRPDLLGD